jgi:capsular exopolysaccharide synthesis family protein
MSQIFDALQRSEAKRTESDASLSLSATELLERAERAATSQRKAESEAEDSGLVRDRGTALFGPDGFGPASPEVGTATIFQALETEERRLAFEQCQKLNTSLAENSRLVCLTEAASPAADAFRLLGVRLRHLRASRNLKSILITSTVPNEGKSVIAANLACTLASGKLKKVLLVGGDVRQPTLTQLFGIPRGMGLCSYLRGEHSLIASVYRLEEPGLWILPAGQMIDGHTELVQSPRLPALMQELMSWFDWIVVDSPPVLPFADTSIWSRLADAVLLVARCGRTEKRTLLKGLEALDPNKLIGAIINSSKATANGDYYYYHRTNTREQ